ncbi:uncharacterized protein LOC122031291 [Zingiber officinale]|uniref:uncharacterized protein LOC122031291 n=1 Tax=Zingiber officinale TaxID=94328 RepID=UPI001C4B7929|nr:uncharacterized protein LOC122031291 [Zingiber officinale]
MAESSPPRDLKKGKAIVLREELREMLEEQVLFSLRVLEEKLPKGYKLLAIGEYDGSKDPEDHLRKFWNAVLLHQYSDAIKCRVLLNTLSSSAQKWFAGLLHGFITYFQDFKNIFLHHFTNSRKYQKTDHCLFALKQGSVEPLRIYVKRFNQVAQDVSSATSEILMSVFSHSLVEGELSHRESVKNFDEMLDSRVAQQVEAVQAPRSGQWGPRYCTYHRSHTHSTRDCVQFARDSRRTAELGLPSTKIAPKLQKLLANSSAAAGQLGKPLPDNAGQGAQQPGRDKEPMESPEEENRRNIAIREIDMIFGGPTDGDSTRVRNFRPQDLEGVELPYDDALIIKVVIANNHVARVFIDTRSFVNVLFKNAFEGMQIDTSELQPVVTSFYGFTGNKVQPMDLIKLVISLGSKPLVRTWRSTFIVVESPFSYNVILGRPTLHKFRAAISTFHQKMKFPVGDQVGEVKGEQLISHRCCVDMVKVEARKAQRTQDGRILVI